MAFLFNATLLFWWGFLWGGQESACWINLRGNIRSIVQTLADFTEVIPCLKTLYLNLLVMNLFLQQHNSLLNLAGSSFPLPFLFVFVSWFAQFGANFFRQVLFNSDLIYLPTVVLAKSSIPLLCRIHSTIIPNDVITYTSLTLCLTPVKNVEGTVDGLRNPL